MPGPSPVPRSANKGFTNIFRSRKIQHPVDELEMNEERKKEKKTPGMPSVMVRSASLVKFLPEDFKKKDEARKSPSMQGQRMSRSSSFKKLNTNDMKASLMASSTNFRKTLKTGNEKSPRNRSNSASRYPEHGPDLRTHACIGPYSEYLVADTVIKAPFKKHSDPKSPIPTPKSEGLSDLKPSGAELKSETRNLPIVPKREGPSYGKLPHSKSGGGDLKSKGRASVDTTGKHLLHSKSGDTELQGELLSSKTQLRHAEPVGLSHVLYHSLSGGSDKDPPASIDRPASKDRSRVKLSHLVDNDHSSSKLMSSSKSIESDFSFSMRASMESVNATPLPASLRVTPMLPKNAEDSSWRVCIFQVWNNALRREAVDACALMDIISCRFKATTPGKHFSDAEILSEAMQWFELFEDFIGVIFEVYDDILFPFLNFAGIISPLKTAFRENNRKDMQGKFYEALHEYLGTIQALQGRLTRTAPFLSVTLNHKMKLTEVKFNKETKVFCDVLSSLLELFHESEKSFPNFNRFFLLKMPEDRNAASQKGTIGQQKKLTDIHAEIRDLILRKRSRTADIEIFVTRVMSRHMKASWCNFYSKGKKTRNQPRHAHFRLIDELEKT